MFKRKLLIFAFASFPLISVCAEVTKEDIENAKKQWESEKNSMDKHNAKRANPEYGKVMEKEKLDALNKAAGTPENTEWFKEKGFNNYRTNDDPHKHTKEYRTANQETKDAVDSAVEAQKDRKESHTPNPNQEAIDILKKEMDPDNQRYVKEEEFEKHIIQEKAKKISEKREAQEKARREAAVRKAAEEKAKREAAAKKASAEKARREAEARDRPRNDGHHRDFDSERHDIKDKMDRGESIDGDRFDRARDTLDTTG